MFVGAVVVLCDDGEWRTVEAGDAASSWARHRQDVSWCAENVGEDALGLQGGPRLLFVSSQLVGLAFRIRARKLTRAVEEVLALRQDWS